MVLSPPSGLDEIIAFFGNIKDSDFEKKNIVSFELPYPLLYDGKVVSRSKCHGLAVENFVAVFKEIKRAGLKDKVKNYGGIYNKRPIRRFPKFPSTHSWGIAIDLEPQLYPLGSKKRFAPEIVQIFKDHGFYYGGDFRMRRDPMHFQLCTNY